MFLFFFTFVACVAQMTRITLNTRQAISYQMGVLLLAAIESFLGVLHWGFFHSTTFNYWIIFLKELQLLVITYFFPLSALTAFNRKDYERKVLWPVFSCIVIFLLLVVLLGSFNVFDDLINAEQCSNITFILLSVSGLVLSTVFLITGILIFRRLKRQSGISENIRKKKKLELWALIFVYFIVSVTSTGEDILDLIVSHFNDACSVFDDPTSWGHMIAIIVQHTVNLLIPIWASLIVYNIEASRAKGKSWRAVRNEQVNSSDPENSLDYDFLVGDYHSVHSYHSDPKPDQTTSDEGTNLL